MKLIYIGAELDDHATPFAMGCVHNTTIHVVRTLDERVLTQAITQADLLGVCRFCQTRGTKFLFRPQCGTCASRSVESVSFLSFMRRSLILCWQSDGPSLFNRCCCWLLLRSFGCSKQCNDPSMAVAGARCSAYEIRACVFFFPSASAVFVAPT
jgi:hypothetical protein